MGERRLPSFALRRAVASDVEAIQNLSRAVYAKWITSIGREPLPMTADYTKAVQDHLIDLAEAKGELLGLVEMILRDDHFFIENLAVAEKMQGMGLGQFLLEHAETVARSHGLTELRLATNKAFQSNLRFYGRRGYDVIDSQTLFDGGTMVTFRKRLTSP